MATDTVESTTKVLTEKQARALTDRIKSRWDSLVEGGDRLMELVAQAQEGKADEALGYKSWTAYIAAEFKDTPMLGLGKEERRDLIVSLSDSGMSTRAIAPVVGVSDFTVREDLKKSKANGASNLAPEEGDVVEAEIVDETPRTVVGLDGKEYKAKPAKAPKPLTTVQKFMKVWPKVMKSMLDAPTSSLSAKQLADVPWAKRQGYVKELDKVIKRLTAYRDALAEPPVEEKTED